jgi:hypothetical protein
MQSFIMLSVIMLSVIILSVIMQSVIMLSVKTSLKSATENMEMENTAENDLA